MPWTTGCPSLRFVLSGQEGPPLVLLHEMGGSLHSWEEVARALDGEFAILRYDQRGAGASEAPREPFTLDDQIDDLEQVLGAARVTPPFVIATVAAAAAIAAGYMLRHPGAVARAAFFAPALGVDDDARAVTIQRAQSVSEKGMRTIAEMALARIYPEEVRGKSFAEYRARFLANDPVGFAHANVAFAESRIDAARLDAACLLVAGGRDIRPPEAIAALARTIPAAAMQVIAEGGHVLAHQRPVQVAAILRRFVGEGLALFTHT